MKLKQLVRHQPRYIIEKKRNKTFCWSLLNRNGQALLSSGVYKSKAACKKGIEATRMNGQVESRFQKLKTRTGKFYFYLKARNGVILGSSIKFEDLKKMQLTERNIRSACYLARTIDLS